MRPKMKTPRTAQNERPIKVNTWCCVVTHLGWALAIRPWPSRHPTLGLLLSQHCKLNGHSVVRKWALLGKSDQKKWHFEWPNQNSKTTFIVQTFPKYCRKGFYFIKQSLSTIETNNWNNPCHPLVFEENEADGEGQGESANDQERLGRNLKQQHYLMSRHKRRWRQAIPRKAMKV